MLLAAAPAQAILPSESPRPQALWDLYQGDDLRLIPELREALLPCFEQYPSVQKGLSVLEQELLEKLSTRLGVSRVNDVDLFVGNFARYALRDMLVWANQPIRYAEPFFGCPDNYEFGGAKLMLTARQSDWCRSWLAKAA